MTRARRVVVLCFALLACGDDHAPQRDAGAAGSDAAPQACDGMSDCDDGVYCNGQERCNDRGVCESEALDCDDGLSCTMDRCSESARACRSEAPDADGDGHGDATCLDATDTPLGDDCDDTDPLRFPGNVERCDADHRDEDCNPQTRGGRDQDDDDFEDALCCNQASDAENAPLLCGDDCDDLKKNVNPLASEACDGLNNDCDDSTDEGAQRALYVDADRDGHGAAGSSPVMACAGASGLSMFNDDCDDDDVTVHGAQVEICDGVNNDCDDHIDESPQAVAWFLDADGDGFGDPRDSVQSCDPIEGRSIVSTDCNDDDTTVSPRAAERCDGIDNDCNGGANYRIEGNDLEDDDKDGVADDACEGGTDCDDRDANTALGASEICDGFDNDCDDAIDESAPSTVWYVDVDHDGYGNARLPASAACFPIPNRSARPGDCDDDEARAYPGAEEFCEGVDNDCDRQVDEDCRVVLDAGGMDASFHPRDGSVMDTDASRAGAGGSGGAGGSSGAGGDAGSTTDAGVDAGDAGPDPLPEIACNEPTVLDGTPHMVDLTVIDQAEGVDFCGVFGQRIAVAGSYSGGGCATLRVVDVENNVVLDRFGCGAFYEELVLPGARPYRVSLSASTVPQTGTLRIWDVPTLPSRASSLNGTPYGVTTAVGQVARWTFGVSAGQRITLSTNGPGCRQIGIRDALGATVVDQFVCGNYVLDNFTVTQTGTFVLSSDISDGNSGEHTLTAWVLGADSVVAVPLDGNGVVPIVAPGNNGRATFNGTAGQRISITATNVGCTTLRLASPSDTTIRSEFVCGVWFSDVLTLTETGQHVLDLDPDGLSTGSSTVSVYVLATDPLVDVAIDGPTAMGSIDKPGNNLTYRFSASAGTRLSASVAGPGCNQVVLWSPSAVSIVSQFVCGPWFVDALPLTASGTYTITLDPNGAQVGATSAALYGLASDPIVAAAIDGVTVSSSVAKPGNNVRFELMGNAGQRISLRASGPGCNQITLFDMNQTSLAAQFVCGEWFLEGFMLPTTQTYAVVIDPNGGQVGPAQITAYDLPPDPSTLATINGATVNATTTTPGQNARFTFSATMGQQITLHATSVGCTNYSLLNPLGNAVFGPTFACGALSQSMVAIAQTGTHTLLVDPSGTSIGTLTFNVTTP